MRAILDRAVFTLSREGDTWFVEYEGEQFGHSSDREVARACAHKRAREMVDRGEGALVRVKGESVRL